MTGKWVAQRLRGILEKQSLGITRTVEGKRFRAEGNSNKTVSRRSLKSNADLSLSLSLSLSFSIYFLLIFSSPLFKESLNISQFVLFGNPCKTYNNNNNNNNHLHPFFEDFGGVSTSNVPSYEWSSWQLRTRRAASVRMFDHKRERCTVCSQCAPLPSTLHPFSLMKKVSFDRFQPLLFDFISRNNGSWAF